MSARTSDHPINLTVQPQQVYIERASAQYLNFDFLAENVSAEQVTLDRIQLSVFDRHEQLVLRRFVDDNGSLASIQTIPQRELLPQQSHLIFNPFFCFDSEIELARLDYQFSFESDTGAEYHTGITLEPVVYTTQTDLILPVPGRIIVWDGHDFYSHHRRFNYLDPRLQPFGIRSNFMRYAYDFVPIDNAGAMSQGSSDLNEHWLGWGVPVRATGAGVVVAAADGQPDNREFNPAEVLENPMRLYGNYVVLDHANGEYSLFGHLQAGSLRVGLGDRVRQGQPIAQIGASGSSLFPHLHYELRTGSDIAVEGLPSAFRDFRRILGAQVRNIGRGSVDTGDILEAQ